MKTDDILRTVECMQRIILDICREYDLDKEEVFEIAGERMCDFFNNMTKEMNDG